MRRRAGLVGIALAAACGPRAPAAAPGAIAGDRHDDGHGLLARASSSFVTPAEEEGEPTEEVTGGVVGFDVPPTLSAGFGGALYGGLGYGGAGYGSGSTWGAAVTPPIEYASEDGLTGAIEGVVTWAGTPPRGAACGGTARVGADRGLGGALVYIEKLDVGRVLPSYAKPLGVGGVVVKRGCALLPPAQIVTPLPSVVTIHGDATAAKLHATASTGAAVAIDLQEGGQVRLDAFPGLIRIDSDDGALTPAWVMGLDTPYYAITDDAGRFRIDELATGTYDVVIWQAPLPTGGAGGRVTYGAPVVAHRSVTVGATRAARLDVALR